jgi:hypothetical protein
MANVLINETAQMRNNGGETFPAVKLRGDGSTAYKAGQWCYVVAGVATPIASGAGTWTTGTAAFGAANQFCVVLKDTTATSDEIEVQTFTRDTRFWAEVVDASASDVTMDYTDIGSLCSLYQDANKKVAVNNATTNGIAEITSTESVEYPWVDDSLGKDSGGTRHSRVEFRIKPSLFA